MVTYKIHIEGQVQGVGFRPFAYQLTLDRHLKGQVTNGMDGVDIILSGEEADCVHYYETIVGHPPKHAIVTSHCLRPVPYQYFRDFSIAASTQQGKASLLLTPDIALCSRCRHELHDVTNRRFHYPFTTCLECGPRYSIISRLPYDRENTSMQAFEMCPSCSDEYNNPFDRRHFSQTNSCPSCPVHLSLVNASHEVLATDPNEIAQRVAESLAAGKILAVKGIGGFLLLADATSAEAIVQLRMRKHRPTKPFALMYPHLDMIRADCLVSDEEETALLGRESPIVLVERKAELATGIDAARICPDLTRLGVMLPYAPLLEWIASLWGRPLIATSANLSGSPVVFKNDQAMKLLGHVADQFLLNDRDIAVPQDDSVVQFVPDAGRIMLRRSRGFAPTYHPHALGFAQAVTLSLGSDLKSTFALHTGDNVYVSQYLGDLESFETQTSFEHTLRHLLEICDATPARVIVDAHPNYFSSLLGRELAEAYGAELHLVQHHKAHFAAVLAENNRMESNEPILGVIWDGTGSGDDDAVWGSEFFLLKNHEMKRVAHLPYYDHMLGDKFSREPRLPALSVARDLPDALPLLRSRFNPAEWAWYQKLLLGGRHVKTSSMGRLFDAVACLLGVSKLNTYEGEAALCLETLAERFEGPFEPWTIGSITPASVLEAVVKAMADGQQAEKIAWQFHRALVDWVALVAEKHRVAEIAFSGGVFQNKLLITLLSRQLKEKYQLHFHRQMSPNDENISLGQLAYVKWQERVPVPEKSQFENVN